MDEEDLQGTNFASQFPSPGLTIVLHEASTGQDEGLLSQALAVSALGHSRARVKAVVKAAGQEVCTCHSEWKMITPENPSPDWQECLHLSLEDLGWTVQHIPQVEVSITVTICSVLGPDIELGGVCLDTMPNKEDDTCALLDLSSSSWSRMCRRLQHQPEDKKMLPVVQFDVISWPPNYPSPSRASSHPHKAEFDLFSSCGMRLFELPTESKNLVQVTSTENGLVIQAHAAVDILDIIHDGMVDVQEFVTSGGTEDGFRQINNADELAALEFEWSIKTESEQYAGCLSPMSKLSLPPAMLERLGIPGDSTHFCFAYSDSKVQTRNSEMEPGLEQMVRRGGFCYFQARDQGPSWQVTSIKAITDSSTKGLQDISFAGWEVVPDHVVKLMETGNKRRFAPSTLVSAKLQTMGERGFAKVAWISPSEDIGGNVFQYGGFMYKFRDGSKPVILHLSKVAKAQMDETSGHSMATTDTGESPPSAGEQGLSDPIISNLDNTQPPTMQLGVVHNVHENPVASNTQIKPIQQL